MLVPNKMQHVLCTGNVGREQYNELRGLAPSVHVVAGDYDDDDLAFPETKVVQIGQFRIGIMHGHQVLPYNSQDAIARMRRKLNVDIFISGHTHKNEVVLQEGFYHINPGSITGAFSSLTDKVIPSFILLAIQEYKLVCYVYELIDGEVEVSKTEFSKTPSQSSAPLMQTLVS